MINMIISYEADKEYTFQRYKNADSTKEFGRNIDRINDIFKENDNKIKDIELKLNNLKVKVLEAAGEIPPWWKENEVYLPRIKKQ